MHSSWLFPGAGSGPKQPTADAASGDQPHNSNGTGFEINSFVRSLNLQGVHLPGGFPFKRATNNDTNRREWSDSNGEKGLNEMLTDLNELVARAVDPGPQARSNTSSLGSFRSGVEDRDLAALNDLVHLVSTTANEFRDITAGNANTENSARNVGPHCTANPVNPPDLGNRTLVHPEIRARNARGPSNFSAPASSAAKSNDSRENSRAVPTTEKTRGPPLLGRRNSRGIDLDDTPNADEFFTPPELVEIYSENQNPNAKRANLSEESLETLRYFETPRYFLPEVLRLAKAGGFADGSSVNRDRRRSNWMPPGRRINFEDELWPIGAGVNNSKAFPPYFTGTPSKTFRLCAAERNFLHETKRSIDSSRSSPIFAGAGEAPAEPLDIVVPTRDPEDSLKHPAKKKIGPGSSGDRSIPLPIGKSGISGQENLIDAPPTKLNKRVVTIDLENIMIEEEKQVISTDISLNIPQEPDDVDSPVASEDKVKRKVCVKVLTKRHRKLCKQMKKNGRKKNSVKADEDTGKENLSSTSQSPMSSARKSPAQSFLEESDTVRSDDEKITGSVEVNESMETQMEICMKNRGLKSNLHAKQLKTHPSKLLIAEKIKLPGRCNVITERQEPSEATTNQVDSAKSVNPKNINQKSRVNNFTQPNGKPADNRKVVSSTSSSSMPKQSRIAQLTPRIRPNTAETSGKFRENTEATNKTKVPVVRKNQSQDVIPERSRGQFLARNSEATVKTPRSRSKQRPGTPKKPGTSEYGRSDVKSLSQDKNSRALSGRDEMNKSAKSIGSNFKTTIPVLRSKTFVYQMKREPVVRRVASKEEYVPNGKSTSIRSSQKSLTSGPVKQLFCKPPKDRPTATKEVNLDSKTNAKDTPCESKINTDGEQSCSDLQLSTNSIIDKIGTVEFSSADSIASKKIPPKKSPSISKASPAEENAKKGATGEREACEQISRCKFHNKHARSLQMLKSILSHQGVSVDSVNKDARVIRSKIFSEPVRKSKIPSPEQKKSPAVSGIGQGNAGPLRASKNLFEKLAILTEALPECRQNEKKDSCEQSVSSFVDWASESATSCARSMRDAEEQCSLPCESSVVSQMSVNSEKSFPASQKQEEITKQVSTVSTEIDDDYRKSIYVDAAVSPTPSETEREVKSFEAAETQTRVKLLDKDSATDEIIQPAPQCINASTETHVISTVSRDANTDCKFPDIVDATSQIDPAENSRNAASGKDSSSICCTSREVNTERPDFFLKSRGVSASGPRKIDGASQFDPQEKSKDIASGRDYVEVECVSQDVNTDRQDYLFEDRSVDVLGPTTAEEACQIDPAPLEIVNVAVGEFSLDVKLSAPETSCRKMSYDLRSIDTVVVKDVDVVQWQSSTTFNTSRVNCGSSCSSTSSLVTWRPKYCQRSSAERLQALGDRVPKEAIIALEMASERAQNLYKAIEIYRESLASRGANEPVLQASKSLEKPSPVEPSISKRSNVKSAAQVKKTCSFRENSKIKSLLDANLEKLDLKMSPSPELPKKKVEYPKLQEEIASLLNDLLTNVVHATKKKAVKFVPEDVDKKYHNEEHFVQRNKSRNSTKLPEIFEEEISNEKKLESTTKNLEIFLFSRNSLLTVIYGTVCSLVFWALQFSITCDSV